MMFWAVEITEVATTSIVMEIVQDSIGFIDGQASMKNGVDPSSV